MYAQRKGGQIVGFARFPNRLTDKTPVDEDSREWKDYLSKAPEKPVAIENSLTPTEKANLIDFYETNRIITAARASTLRGN